MPSRLFAALSSVILLVAVAHTQSYTETTLHNFGVSPTDGQFPMGRVVLDKAGNLYGVTTRGGGTAACSGGCGVVFKLDSAGKETILHRFRGGADGENPFSPLTIDADGNLYGMTPTGGVATKSFPQGIGIVFRISAAGQYSILYKFRSESDGMFPGGRLTLDSAGNLYGTTFEGGTFDLGTVFKLTPKGIKSILHNFTGGIDGSLPANLARDDEGNLYGTAGEGGALGQGVLFKLTPQGDETVLYSFCSLSGCMDGSVPVDIVRDPGGDLFVSTAFGGAGLQGTIFEFSSAGTASTLYSFCPGGAITGCNDGQSPAGLLFSRNEIYGTTLSGGAGGFGVVYRLTQSGVETVLFSFPSDDSGGANPAGMTIDSAGNLYGTATNGLAAGTAFKLIKN